MSFGVVYTYNGRFRTVFSIAWVFVAALLNPRVELRVGLC